MFKDMLKQVMEEQNLNASSLSAVTGVGKSSISQYLNGKNEPPEKKKTKMAVALGLAPDYFQQIEIQEDLTAVKNLPVPIAAKLMGKSKEFVYQGLRDGIFPWGYAVKMEKRWTYYISPAAFEKWTGLKIN